MSVSIRAIDPVSRSFFAGEVSGVDITEPLSHRDAEAISAGMDQYGVLVFHDQRFTDDTQLAFSRTFGALEQATGDIAIVCGTPTVRSRRCLRSIRCCLRGAFPRPAAIRSSPTCERPTLRWTRRRRRNART